MIDRREFMILVLTSFILAVAFYPKITAIVSPQYDPWADLNDDGRVNIKDAVLLGVAFGTSGDPTKNVTVTNFPKANNHLTVILNVSQHVGSDSKVLSASNEVTGIGNKTVTFISGGVSGGATWSSYDINYGSIAGVSPGIGRVEVYDSYNTLMAQFVLPLNAMFEVQNVSTIKVYAESPIPKLTANVGYSAYVVASIYWIEQ